jgi:beta-N-acetylhexosaminidase
VIARRVPAAIAACLLLASVGGCTNRNSSSGSPSRASSAGDSVGPPGSAGSTDPAGTAASTGPVSTGPAADVADRVLAAMTEPQRIGQLFMVGNPATGTDPAVLAEIRAGQVGSVFLAGNSTAAASQTAAVVSSLQQPAGATRLFIATDQEGGTVQRLKGPDFPAIPSALSQGASPPATERANAQSWGRQLAAAGVNLDLAPVLDTVTSPAAAAGNPPIGALDREFGYSPALIAASGNAFVQGLSDAGIDTTVKHFPGLGRVTANTDTRSGVTDTVTTRTDPDLAPFAAAIAAGTPFVMMSLAIYSKIDPSQPAAFSSTVITGLLRADLHFAGVVISDDLGATQQVAGYSVGDRAVRFVAAGGDVVLTVSPDQIPAMAAAVLARTRTDPAFAAQVDAATLRVLEAKQARSLLG